MPIVQLVDGTLVQVDEEDVDLIQVYRWRAYNTNGKSYVMRSIRGGVVYLHRQLLGLQRGDRLRVDHRNGDTLDNRRDNLRFATAAQNSANSQRYANNTTGAKGVSLFKRTGRFRAEITSHGKYHHLGYFETIEQAKAAYEAAASQLNGEFARV